MTVATSYPLIIAKGILMFLIVLFLSACFIINAESIPRSLSNPKTFLEIKDHLFQIYFLGKGELLNHWEKKYFSSLYILHLLTPSGLHLTSLFIPIRSLLKRFFKNPKTRFYIKILVILPLCFIESFHSLRRVAIFLVLLSLNEGKGSGPNQSIQKCFWLTFLIDFMNNFYFKSPLSFAYSFLFWGSIIVNLHKSKFQIILSLGIAQILLCYLLGLNFYPIGFFFGQFITFVYCLLFPILVFLEPLSVYFFNETFIIPYVHKTLYEFGKILYSGPSISIALPYLLFIIIPNKRFSILLLLFVSYDCNPTLQSKKTTHELRQGFLKNKKIHRVLKSPKTDWIQTEEGEICSAKLKDSYWKLRCKDLPSHEDPAIILKLVR